MCTFNKNFISDILHLMHVLQVRERTKNELFIITEITTIFYAKVFEGKS